ncbi:MAG: hypothetical protein GY814_03265 [Gammaproteobacteria bacterium]|nr:hypothetical protein [Gammaproteobacteria bacterium]
MHKKEAIITREELFIKVWLTPISKLALEFGLSDVGLAKICKRMEVPRPKRGYWQKIEAGKTHQRSELPPLSSKGVGKVAIYPTRKMPKPSSGEIEIEHISCPDNLVNPHPLTSKTLHALKNGKIGDRNILIPRNKIYLDIRVTKDCVERACLIMDTLVKALVYHNFTIKIKKGDPARTLVVVQGEEIEIGIDEKIKSVDHVLTPKEKTEYGGYIGWTPRFDHVPTGNLTLKIRNAIYLGIRQSWSDGKIQIIENCLGTFITGLHHAAYVIKEHRQECEQREKERAERNRQWHENQRLVNIEKQKIEKLSSDIESWQTAENIRRYIEEVKRASIETDGLEIWVEWALGYAAKIDPIKHSENLAFKEEEN